MLHFQQCLSGLLGSYFGLGLGSHMVPSMRKNWHAPLIYHTTYYVYFLLLLLFLLPFFFIVIIIVIKFYLLSFLIYLLYYYYYITTILAITGQHVAGADSMVCYT